MTLRRHWPASPLKYKGMKDRLLKPEQDKIAEARDFYQGFTSVILGSVSESGLPHTSYAPYITDQGKFYIYVSGLAQHSISLKTGKASLFFIENENQAKTIFARTRLTIHCDVTERGKAYPEYTRVLDRFQQHHGSTVELLRTLPDFILFELTPLNASFVTGFGAAFDMSPFLNQLIHPAQ